MTSDLPAYLVLAEELAKGIASLQHGERLPSEVELAERHKVSLVTARAAMQELERRYLVRRARGSGTYVVQRVEYVISPRFTPWSEMVEKAGAATSRAIVSSKGIRASDEVRQGLGLPESSRVVEIVRLATVNEIAANITYSYLPDDLAPQFDELLATAGTDLIAVLRALGYQPERSWAHAELTVPDVETARALDVGGRPPLWQVVHCIVDGPSARPLALSYAWNRPDVLRVRFEFGHPTIPLSPSEMSHDPGKDTA
ncbi:GntR family transcriptional regulator [Streptomyces sp. NPDC004752]